MGQEANLYAVTPHLQTTDLFSDVVFGDVISMQPNVGGWLIKMNHLLLGLGIILPRPSPHLLPLKVTKG